MGWEFVYERIMDVIGVLFMWYDRNIGVFIVSNAYFLALIRLKLECENSFSYK